MNQVSELAVSDRECHCSTELRSIDTYHTLRIDLEGPVVQVQAIESNFGDDRTNPRKPLKPNLGSR